jgi:hypothetical protein
MRRLLTVIAVGALLASACSSSKQSSTPSTAGPGTTVAPAPPRSPVAVPTVTGPVSGGTPDVPVNAAPPSLLAKYGYSEREYFFSGTATAYTPVGSVGADGRWTVARATTAPYKSRMVVRTPADPKKFNGTVVVEWLNETAGRDADPDFGFAHLEIMRDGDAYAAVSAQALGITGEGAFKLPIPGYDPVSLKVQNPARYGTLVHPGDAYSYDIFSQAAQALWRPNGANPLGSLHPQRLIATGESQSATRMVTYVDAFAKTANLFDGFMIHSRGGSPAPINSAATDAMPPVARIRPDLGRPVLMIETETDLFGLGFFRARQPDTDFVRTWEMAGTAHADQSTLDYGIASGHVWTPGVQAPDFTALCGRINNGPEAVVVSAAFAALNTWVEGRLPAPATPFEIAGGTAIARDAHGNALGGVRSPAVDVPVSTLDGTLAPGKSVICSLFGSVTPFTAATLKALYPTHDDYVRKVKAAAAAAVAAAFLLPADAEAIVAQAQAAPIPS